MTTRAHAFLGTIGAATWLALVALLFSASLQARVVGMVIDDSGSMKNSFQKALFAAQILIGSLSPEDRLFVVRLNGGRGKIDEVAAPKRAEYLAQMQRDWGMGQETPYQPLAEMLAHLASETRPGEQADLLVFADGAFTGAVPADPQREFEALKARFVGGRLQVFFVWLPGDPPEVDLRAPLLSVFNGSPTEGAKNIDDRSQVFPGLRDVIARLSGADPVETGKILRQDGNRVRFQLPFGVRRIVVITGGDKDHPPAAWRAASFPLNADPPLAFAPRMLQADQKDAVRLQANVVHLVPREPLPPGTAQEIGLDRPLGPDDRLLFDSDLRIGVDVLDDTGQPLPRDSQGRLRVLVGERIQVKARFLDRVGGQWRPLSLDGSGLLPEYALSDGSVSRPMDIDRRSGEGRSPLGPYGSAGRHTLTVTGRIKGLKYLRADDLVIEVLPPTDVHPRLSAHRLLPCDGCPADRVELPLAPGPDGAHAVALEAAARELGKATDFLLAAEHPLPPGIALLGPDGTAVFGADGRGRLRIQPERPTQLMLRYDDDLPRADPIPLQLTLTAADKGLTGSASLTLDLVPVGAPLRLVEDGHSGADQNQPFSVPVTQVGSGQGVFIRAEGLRGELSETHLRVGEETDLPMGLTIEQGRILVTPERAWWSNCWIETGSHPYRISYRNPETLQSADYAGALTVTPVPWWQRCWREALLALALILALLKLLCARRSETFPPRSRVVRCLGSGGGAFRRRLHSPLRAFFLCSAERRRVYELTLVARGYGVGIRRASGMPAQLIHTRFGETLDQVFEKRQTDEITWGWTDELMDEDKDCRYVLVQDIAKRPDAC